jgi:hypothetical protein
MIPHLEDLSIAQRIILTIVIVLIVLFCVAAVGFFSGKWEAEGQDIATTKYDAHLVGLDKLALDDAYHNQLLLLFSVWLKDAAGTDATRISNGLRIARRSYMQAATQIEQRERALPAR